MRVSTTAGKYQAVRDPLLRNLTQVALRALRQQQSSWHQERPPGLSLTGKWSGEVILVQWTEQQTTQQLCHVELEVPTSVQWYLE